MEGDCHYLEGNLNARRRVVFTQNILEQIGLPGQRLKMINISSAMGAQFAQAAQDFSKMITELGPNPLQSAASAEAGTAAFTTPEPVIDNQPQE